MRQVDLNADLGELADGSLDAAVMPHISSANIACGGHAGSPERMRQTVLLAKQHNVALGAHPGYPDPENFGRKSLPFSQEELCVEIRNQILTLKKIAEEERTTLRHVKLHGALYNDLVDDYDRAFSICTTIAEIDPYLRFIGFSNSAMLRAAEDAGLVAVHEVFSDRRYRADGKLLPRSQPDAVILNEAACLDQVKNMLNVSNPALPADSVCVHGDNPSAITLVSMLRNFLESEGFRIRPAGDHTFSFSALGENSLLVQLPPRISKSTQRVIRALQLGIEQANITGVAELTPCYAELKIDFDPLIISLNALQERVTEISENLDFIDLPAPRLIKIPVCYEPPYAPDLAEVARYAGLSEEEVIHRHSQKIYTVHMLGFTPGFAYLGGLDPRLATPRHATPRTEVPAGAVGIAGNQTGIYPCKSPGGWLIIGRTATPLFDPTASPPFLFEAGDEVRFIPVAELEDRSSLPSPHLSIPNSRTVKIIDPGMYTTVQDTGRFGYLRYGLPPSGAMDQDAFRMANRLLGNEENFPVLEVTGTMPVLEFSGATRIAVVSVGDSQYMEVKAGTRVSFDPLKLGYRAYIAFEGGIDVPVVMGSRSTYVSGKLGGHKGRTLRAGDVLPLGAIGDASSFVMHEWLRCNEAGSIVYVRVIPGPEADWFDCNGLSTFLAEAFTISSKSDRTGLRLDGPELSFCSGEQMVSAGIAFGTIQVPPSGHPIIMMADHPTTGGYPRIGTVVRADLPILAQLKPGDTVQFVEVQDKAE